MEEFLGCEARFLRIAGILRGLYLAAGTHAPWSING